MRAVAVLAVLGGILLVGLIPGCSRGGPQESPELRRARDEMVTRLYKGGLITNSRVVNAMRQMPRHEFLPEGSWPQAYSDEPVATESGRTLSSPSLAALALQELNPMPRHKVLMVDPPDAFIPAVASRLCQRVTVIVMQDADAENVLWYAEKLGLDNIEAHACDVAQGWATGAPYTSVLFGYTTHQVPSKIIEQLDDKGTIVELGDGGAAARTVEVMKLLGDEVTQPRVVTIPGGV